MATKSTAAEAETYKTDYFKMPDFGQYQADMNRWFGDFSKSFTNGKTPSVDFEGLFAAQRKNFEAFASANQLAFDGVKAVAQRQAELAREAVEEFQKLAKELSAPASAEEKLAKQAEVAKAAGISHAYLFRLFATKNDLAVAVVERANQVLDA